MKEIAQAVPEARLRRVLLLRRIIERFPATHAPSLSYLLVQAVPN